MRFATLISWLFTVSLGAFMLRTWLARDGLRRERAKRSGLPPPLIFGHASAAVVGLLSWAVFVASGARPFAWAGVILLTVAVSLGLCTVTLWTPYPARRPGERRPPSRWDGPAVPVRDVVAGAARPPTAAEQAVGQAAGQAAGQGEAHPAFEVTDDMITQFLANPTPRDYPIRLDPAVLIPVLHGFAALITYLLAMTSAVTAMT